jgi:hypothetical protein
VQEVIQKLDFYLFLLVLIYLFYLFSIACRKVARSVRMVELQAQNSLKQQGLISAVIRA